MEEHRKKILEEIYQRLYWYFGPQHWWPGRTSFEVMVGAVLTQNTNWGNVEKAIRNLREKQLLTPQKLKSISVKRLASLIRPAGYFNVKAKRLKNFIAFLFEEYGGNLNRMRREKLREVRSKLLRVNGIGPETADSILLYALSKPIFVVDNYTKRILSRHNLVNSDADYHSVQKLFMRSLTPAAKLFNEYHALIVRTGKELCKPRPSCELCPVNEIKGLPKYRPKRSFTRPQKGPN